MTKKKIKIEIVSDVVCPWCYIGKRRLERAIHTLNETYDFEITYLPFELNPSIPESGVNQKQYLTNKFGGEERYRQITGHVSAMAAEEGLSFNFDKQLVSPNTRKAHRIIQYAKMEGKQASVKEAFMSAYFEKGIDLSKSDNLLTIAEEAGLSKENVKAVLQQPDGDELIQKMERELQQLGVSGVPFYIINDKYGISGAQPAEVFMQAFANS
jgi:predicted DsbA family dithiol-disulfide isomerase